MKRLVENSIEVATITTALEDWFNREIASSTTGHNSALDDYEQWQRCLPLPYKDSANVNARKASGHVGRLTMFTDQIFAKQPENDRALAKQLFCIQMHASGLFRNECMLVSPDQATYRRRRTDEGPLGVSINHAIAARVRQHTDTGKNISFQATPDLAVTLPELVQRTHFMNGRQTATMRVVHTYGVIDAGREHSPSVTALHEMQKDWLSLAADYIVYAAQTKENGFAGVPFLEPKSITEEPQVYFPFQPVPPTA